MSLARLAFTMFWNLSSEKSPSCYQLKQVRAGLRESVGGKFISTCTIQQATFGDYRSSCQKIPYAHQEAWNEPLIANLVH